MRSNEVPEKVTMDKSGANKAAINQIIENKEISIEVRQVKYLNNIVEQDHRAIKRVTRPMLGFKSFRIRWGLSTLPPSLCRTDLSCQCVKLASK